MGMIFGIEITSHSPKAEDAIRKAVTEFVAELPERIACKARLTEWPEGRQPKGGKRADAKSI